jgi:HSP20 family protein
MRIIFTDNRVKNLKMEYLMGKKNLTKYDPIDRIFGLREDFDDIVKDFLTGFSNISTGRGVYPLLDIKEDKEKYIIDVEVPGIEKKDLKLSIREGNLIISGEKTEEKKKEGESYLRVERIYGNFMRSVNLPEEVDSSKITARYSNGVLKIFLPKIEKEKIKEVEVTIT